MAARAVFLSPMCLLDRRSGAAIELRTWLEWLAEAGWECHAITLSVFDGSAEYPLERALGPEGADPAYQGKRLVLEERGVTHHIYRTTSTVGRRVTGSEQKAFLGLADHLLASMPPDLVLSYGSSDFTRRLQDIGRNRGKRFVFYLANAQFRDPGLFRPTDRILCPSRYLAAHYHRTLGLDPDVLWTAVDPANLLDQGTGGVAAAPGARHLGLITFFNPMPIKGLPLFLGLARMARDQRPDLTFLAVEGRLSRTALQEADADPAAEPNVWLVPNQREVTRIYQRTSLLLMPSFWAEAAGRVIPEAQLNGIPVLATRRGGIPEQLNGGGFLFDLPASCAEDHRRMPSPEAVQPWLDRIAALLDSEAAYREASQAACTAAEPFRPEHRKAAVRTYFAGLLEGPGPG